MSTEKGFKYAWTLDIFWAIIMITNAAMQGGIFII